VETITRRGRGQQATTDLNSQQSRNDLDSRQAGTTWTADWVDKARGIADVGRVPRPRRRARPHRPDRCRNVALSLTSRRHLDPARMNRLLATAKLVDPRWRTAVRIGPLPIMSTIIARRRQPIDRVPQELIVGHTINRLLISASPARGPRA
jgi:hypothetical protein